MINRFRHNFRLVLFLLGALLLTACATIETPTTFVPKGPASARILTLWWLMFGLGAFVFVTVLAILVWGLWRPRTAKLPRWLRNGRSLILIGGVAVPILILTVVFGFTLSTLKALAPPAQAEERVIEVVGHQWWWEVNYPQAEIQTANEIHIPVGQPVQINLTSDDVIHSFWVPELHGKLDLIPGRENRFWIQADEPGKYWGLCTEFCGLQHANMYIVVVAVPLEEFLVWQEQHQEAAVTPPTDQAQAGFEIFFEAGCDECHAIDGTEADGDLGPNLTHFASRLYLGAGVAENTRAHLSAWLANPQALKPGNLMPASDLSGADMQSLLVYLESLE